MYKCIESFAIGACDGDGFSIENEDMIVEKGSIWSIPEDENYRFIGGEIRLESDEFGWIEITKENLEQCFILMKTYKFSLSAEIEKCKECPFTVDVEDLLDYKFEGTEACCYLNDKEMTYEEYYDKKPKWCPLVEVKE